MQHDNGSWTLVPALRSTPRDTFRGTWACLPYSTSQDMYVPNLLHNDPCSGIHAQGLSTLGATMTPESGTYPQVPCSRLNCCASTKRHLREQSCVLQPSSKLLLQRRHDTLTACSPAIRVHVYKLVLVSRAFRASYRRLQPPGGSLTHSLVWSISRGVIYVHARRYRWVGISARAPRNVFCMLFLNGPCSGADRSTGLNNCA